MTKTEILDAVFEVHGPSLSRCRSSYSAQTKSPVSVTKITNVFKSWNAFHTAYMVHCVTKRAKQPIVTKVTKGAKDDDKE